MGSHIKSCQKAYRKRRKERKKKKKKTILQTGNLMCNVIPEKYRSSCASTNFSISGIQSMTDTSSTVDKTLLQNDALAVHEEIECKPVIQAQSSLADNKCKPVKSHAKTIKCRSISVILKMCNDPLLIGLKEYMLLKNRIKDIEGSTRLKDRQDCMN